MGGMGGMRNDLRRHQDGQAMNARGTGFQPVQSTSNVQDDQEDPQPYHGQDGRATVDTQGAKGARRTTKNDA